MFGTPRPNVGSLLRRASVKSTGIPFFTANGSMVGGHSLHISMVKKENKTAVCNLHSDALTLNGPPPCS